MRNPINNADVQITGTLAEFKAEQPVDLSVLHGSRGMLAADDMVSVVVGPYRRKLRATLDVIQARVFQRNSEIKSAMNRLEADIHAAATEKTSLTEVQNTAKQLFSLLDLGYRSTFDVKINWDAFKSRNDAVVETSLKLFTDRKGHSSYSSPALTSDREFTLVELDLTDKEDFNLIFELRRQNSTDGAAMDRLRREIDKLPEIEREAAEAVTLKNLEGDAQAMALVTQMKEIMDKRSVEHSLDDILSVQAAPVAAPTAPPKTSRRRKS